MQYTWDERKRKINLAKHFVDFGDGYLVIEHPEAFESLSIKTIEERYEVIAPFGEEADLVLVVYHPLGDDECRIISMRLASHQEEILYKRFKQKKERDAKREK